MIEYRPTRFAIVATIIIAIVILCIAAFFGSSARSEGVARCAPYKEMIVSLSGQFKEEPAAAAVSSSVAIELWKKPDGKTWTLLAINTSGMACIVAAGQDWTFHKLELPGKDA